MHVYLFTLLALKNNEWGDFHTTSLLERSKPTDEKILVSATVAVQRIFYELFNLYIYCLLSKI